jgi:ABC-2 type transport system ATP-binding protein
MQALSIRGLAKTYANGVQALKGIDLDVEEGDFFALLGPNGAGKTTAIGIVTSLVTKSAGSVAVFGHDIDRELERAKSCIGLVPQEINFNMFEKVFTIVVNQAGFYGIPRRAVERAERCLRQLQLWDKRDAIARSLSGGMKRRLMIARALMHEPRLLILDEPTAGVDIEIRRSMWVFLREINASGTTIILTTHYLEEAESLCRMSRSSTAADHRERPHVERDPQAQPGDLRAQPARQPGRAPELPGYAALVDGRPHPRGRGVEGAEPERHLRAAVGAGHRGAQHAQQGQPARGAVHAPRRDRSGSRPAGRPEVAAGTARPPARTARLGASAGSASSPSCAASGAA